MERGSTIIPDLFSLQAKAIVGEQCLNIIDSQPADMLTTLSRLTDLEPRAQ
jgi:hypothetical protein